MTKRLNNLAMVLSEEEGNEEVPDIPDDAAESWTEEMVREYYRNGGKLPEEQLEEEEAESSVEWQLQQVKALSQVVPGGTIEENLHKRQASTRIDNVSDLKDAEVIEPGYYREACVTDGIPFRQNGLFPPGDKTLIMLSSNKQVMPLPHTHTHEFLLSSFFSSSYLMPLTLVNDDHEVESLREASD